MDGMQMRKTESPATHLLISMLIRYPEVSSVRFEPESQSLVFSFFLQGAVDAVKRTACLKDLTDHFEVCAALDRQFAPMGMLTFTPLEEMTLVTYQQSINRISTTEIHLLTAILRRNFSGEVELDPLAVDEEDQKIQEELIDRLLGHRDVLAEDRQIVAFRDGGRVFVYNR